MAVAHIGHAELGVTDLEASRRFFTETIGLSVSQEDEDRVFLRAWQDWDHHTLILKRFERSVVEHVGWRVEGPEDLRHFEKRLKALGIEHHWVEGGTEPGQGDGLRFLTPAGLPLELYWEVKPYLARNAEVASRLPSHPQRVPRQGIGPRRFDHANFLIDEVEPEQVWLTNELGIHHRYYLESVSGARIGSWLSRTNVSHEIGIMRNRNQSGALLHHIAYYLDSPDQVVRAATLLADHGTRIEWGPGQHGTSSAMFLYFFEPSGHRVELWTGGMLIFAPDWKALRWDPDNASYGFELWGSQSPETYFTYGTPIRPITAAPGAVSRYS